MTPGSTMAHSWRRNSGNQSAGAVGTGTGPLHLRIMGGPDGFPVYDLDGNLIQTTAGGNWYQKTATECSTAPSTSSGHPTLSILLSSQPGCAQEDEHPVPEVALSPNGDQIVNLPSWFWVRTGRPSRALRRWAASLFV